MAIREKLQQWLPHPARPQIVPAGTYTYHREADGQQTRFHLRVDADGGGLLLANATVAARLHPTGVLIARGLLAGDDESTVARAVRQSFRGAAPGDVGRDVEHVKSLIAGLAAPGDNYPILNLADAAFGIAPRLERSISADVLLAAPERVVRVLDRLWQVGIPHVTLHATEGMPSDWRVRAVERAEDLGMIAGIRARASDLDRPGLLKDLALAGIDHVNVYVLSADAAAHDKQFGEGDHATALRITAELLALEVCPVAEVPLLEATFPAVDATVDALARCGLGTLGFYALAATDDLPAAQRDGALTPQAVIQVAALIEESSAEWSVRSLWYPPLRRDPQRTASSQLRGGPPSSGDHAIRVAPDGAVYAPRGAWTAAGNVLRDDWDALRAHPAFAAYLAEVQRPTHCDVCPGLAVCAALCPRSPQGWVESWPAQAARKEADA